MAMQKQYRLLTCTVALVAVIAFLSAPSRPKQDSVQELRKGGLGSAEEAFAVASRTVDDYLSTLEGGPVVIDSQFRATLLSRSKIWTVKGYASCSHDNHKSYQWTVILNYHDMQDWETLATIATPEITGPDSSQTLGAPQVDGKLFQTHHGR